MSMKPMLFNQEMVRAILDGKKTVTRRIAKKIPIETHGIELLENGIIECHRGGNMSDVQCFVDGSCKVQPPCKIGDILYVRETWSFQDCDNCTGDCAAPPPDKLNGKSGCYVYRSDYGTTEDDTFPPSMHKWRPSLHMPKVAARIFLKVTDVRVERLNDTTIQDMINEGINTDGIITTDGPIGYRVINRFEELWDSTIKKSDIDIYSFDANPWVWVIDFERVTRKMWSS